MKKITLLLSALMQCLSVISQITFPMDIPSPNALELGGYANVPISYYTGKANISIPLYSLTVKGVTLPVELTYNSGGVLINKLPGWTGDNWILQAGGAITRIKQGLCDETIYPEGVKYGELNKEMRSYFQSYHTLPNLINNPTNEYQQLKDTLKEKIIDLSPDIYLFNFLGHTGEFYLGNDGQWKVLCDENLDVVFDIEDSSNYIAPLFENYPPPFSAFLQPKTIKGFLIRDSSGLQYRFGGSCDFIEYSLPLFAHHNRDSVVEIVHSWTANNWYLREIRDRLGNLLFSFEYERGCYVAQIYNNGCIFRKSSTWPGYIWDNGSVQMGCNYGSDGGWPYDGVLTSPIYLKRIICANGQFLDFVSSDLNKSTETIYDTMYEFYGTYERMLHSLHYTIQAYYYLTTDDSGPSQYQYLPTSSNKRGYPLISMRLRKLDDVLLKDKNGSVISRSYLYYETYHRFRLQAVSTKDANHNSIGKYDLSYYNYYGLPGDYISLQDDHWGYYSGRTYSRPAWNSIDEQSSFYGQRNPTNSSLCGMLKQIKYPTGGRTVFEYENHDFSGYVSSDRLSIIDSVSIAGGVRIASISDYEDGTDNNLLKKRTYTYIDPQTGNSSGILYSRPRYYWNCWRAYNKKTNSKSYLSLFRNISIIPLSTSFGPHVGYSYIKETVEDGTYKEYRYSSLSTAKDCRFDIDFSFASETPFDLYTSQEYKRGRLLSVKTCDNNHNTRQLTEYQYRVDDVEASYVLTTNLSHENYVNNLYHNLDHYTGGIYKLFYPKYDIVHSETTTCYESGNVTDIVNYEKSDSILITTADTFSHQADIRITHSETRVRGSNIHKTVYTYPFDSTISTDTLMSFKYFMIHPLAVETKLNGVTTHKQQTTYQNYQGMILPQYEKERKNGQAEEIVRTYLTFDPTNGNLLSYQDQGKPIYTQEWSNDGCLLTKKTYGSGLFEEITYNNQALPSTIRYVNGDSRYFEYDGLGRVTKERGVFGEEKVYQYNYKNK